VTLLKRYWTEWKVAAKRTRLAFRRRRTEQPANRDGWNGTRLKGLFLLRPLSAEWVVRRKHPVCPYRPSAEEASKLKKRACWETSKVEARNASPMGIENRDGKVPAPVEPS